MPNDLKTLALALTLALAACSNESGPRAEPVAELPPIPQAIDLYWDTVARAGLEGGERLIPCGPSPRDPSGRCAGAGGADVWAWFISYADKGAGYTKALSSRMPGDLGDPAISYTPMRDGRPLPPFFFKTEVNRDAFAACWESGACELGFGLWCEAGLTKAGDAHFAQPVLPYYYVRPYRHDGGQQVNVLFANVHYAGSPHEPTAEGFQVAADYLEDLGRRAPAEISRAPLDRPWTPWFPPQLYAEFTNQQQRTDGARP